MDDLDAQRTRNSLDRLHALLAKADYTLQITVATENRIKAYIERLNEHPDFNDPADHLDPDDPASVAVTAEGLIETALAMVEESAGLRANYDGTLRPLRKR